MVFMRILLSLPDNKSSRLAIPAGSAACVDRLALRQGQKPPWESAMDAVHSRDAIVVEIVRSALNNISAEMGTAVCRGGYSTSIKEGGDASNAIFDARGRLVAQSDG